MVRSNGTLLKRGFASKKPSDSHLELFQFLFFFKKHLILLMLYRLSLKDPKNTLSVILKYNKMRC